MDVASALSIMIQFGILIVTLLSLVVTVVVLANRRKDRPRRFAPMGRSCLPVDVVVDGQETPEASVPESRRLPAFGSLFILSVA